MSEQAIDEAALGRWLEANVEGFRGPFELTKFPSGQSNPTYRIARRVGRLCAAPQAVRAAAAVGARGRPRISAARRRCIRSASRCREPLALVRRSGGHRRDLLRDGAGEGPALRQRRSARTSTRRRGGACTSSWSIRWPTCTMIDPEAAGPRRFRQAGQLFRAAGDALDAAVSRLPDRLSPGDGAADRLPAGDACPSSRARRSSTATIASTMSCSTATAR